MHLLSHSELKQRLARQEDFLLLNVLPISSFQKSHIPGSQHASVSDADFVKQVESLLATQDKTYPIVTYCGGFHCNASKIAANLLLESGYTNVSAFEGGMEDWLNAGYPSSGSDATTCEEHCAS